jgi:hypothetical protein
VEDFLQNLMQINKTIVPKIVTNGFKKAFPDAINIEWYHNGQIFEAVFHENDLEKIAIIDSTGSMVELKINLLLKLIPSSIADIASQHGEIMNAIKIISGEEITFEIIIRDQKLDRYKIEFDKKGFIYNKNLL